MSEFITQQILNDYRRDGVVCIRNVFDQHWIHTIRRGIDNNLQNPSVFSEKLVDEKSSVSSGETSGGRSGGAYFNDYCNWRSIPEFKDFILNSPSAQISGILMDSKHSVFYHEHVLVKEACTNKGDALAP